MGLIGLFFKFAGHCFDVLAWFCILFPLTGSVLAGLSLLWAIPYTQKLITYWVCFSLILLFENALSKLLECLPWWTYIKLVIVVCLVTPHFDGSLYVYKHIVHPCLSMDPLIFLNRLIKLMEFFKKDNMLVEVKNAKETGAEALENLIPFKPEFEETKVVQKDISLVEVTESKELASTKQVRQIEPDLASAGNRTSAPLDFKEMTPAVFAARDLPDVLQSNSIQKEWTCAVCQLTTASGANVISHLRGKRHQDACEKLKVYNQTLKSKVSPASEMENAKLAESRGNLPDKQHCKRTHEPWTCALCHVTTTNKADLVSHFQGRRHKDALEKLKTEIRTSKSRTSPALTETGSPLMHTEMATAAAAGRDVPDLPWTCAVCNTKIQHETSLISHLEGRRHEDACKNYKVKNQIRKSLWCAICNISCSSEGNMQAHLEGNMHLTRTQELISVGSKPEN
ncbi:uncharacterized protein LOC110648302 isoform X3 [Hevea brasiliensis]|uniref:uncharacterized protein LOC110648302 isoform X3 n=1 Tax=Hevea brasiliensis TaxID=3981 RepID=UPI000B7853AC|nr:uncharacterized protein LOC110648302 isoform X3 [Hevea brasiliensis]